MNPEKVFEAKARPIHELFIAEGGVAGFRIPIFQRTYDWGEDNIKRLFEDVSSGLFWRNNEEASLTFLGTIILVYEDTSEQDFEGTSLSIIDGQQRLTTLTLLASKLHQNVDFELSKVDGKVKSEVYNWLKRESEATSRQLINLIYGSVIIKGGNIFPFPRIIREYVDVRAKTRNSSEYRSVIGKYLDDYSWYVIDEIPPPFESNLNKNSEGHDSFVSNLSYVDKYIEWILDDTDSDFNLTKLKNFRKSGFLDLYNKYPRDEGTKLIDLTINEGETVLRILRLISFSNYLLSSVVVTVVTTREEKYAFEIFDSLNTTGEPLTAIQTFKPQVIRFESKIHNGYIGSSSEQHFKIIEEYLNNYSESSRKQKESKELVIPFALYLSGETISKSLDVQRSYLRSSYTQLLHEEESEKPRVYVKNLSEVVDYKKRFWDASNLITQIPKDKNRSVTLLFLKFFKDMNMSLTIPIICRYFHEAKRIENINLFSEAVNALAAFVILRRASTGGTKGIDSDLRSIMEQGGRTKPHKNKPLCIGLNRKNEIVDLKDFKNILRDWLSKNRIEVHDKKSWLNKVERQGLASHSRHLCRILMLAALHNSRPSEDLSWKLEPSKRSKETNYLNIETWESDIFSTVEHIAPERPNGGWDELIYIEPYLKDSLGNLTVLPQKENSMVANRNWDHKRLIYKAFLAENNSELKKIIDRAKNKGFNFSAKNKKILDQGEHLPYFKTIVSEDAWTAELIKNRTNNIANLAWDRFAPWLFE